MLGRFLGRFKGRLGPVLGGALALQVSACASLGVVEGDYRVGEATYRLDQGWSDLTWARQPAVGLRLLTRDGPGLNSLYLSEGLKPGQGLARPENYPGQTIATWRSAMTPQDQAQFLTSSVERYGLQQAEVVALSEVEINGVGGLRFQLSARTPKGLIVQGLGQIMVYKERAYVALYLAPQEHFYPSGLMSVHNSLDSVKF